MVKELESQDEFDAALESAADKLIVIDFSASWCGPCKRIAPIYEEISCANPDVLFYKVDVDDVADLAEKCGIQAMPTFQFFKNKKKVAEIRGADAAALKKKISELK
ncbi:thioredoxin-like [Pyxicephalus adspersus]|uniref:Thioredoxin n=1 Tax=Pyxicephalus adspersus TaxID=30357 RepID=A0AAV3B0U8_PYXAD|nr:TPA: hypothetical protein GDO54_008591 [Pyxicephalus adspersus]